MPDSLRKFISKTDPIEEEPAEARWLCELRRYRSLTEALGGNLRTGESYYYNRSHRVRVREEARRMWCTEIAAGAFLAYLIVVSYDHSF